MTPVVHRIPLYAVPGIVERGSEDERRINAIHQEITTMIGQGADPNAVMGRMIESFGIGTYRPVFARSGPRGIETVDLRQQVPEDYRHLCDIAELMLRHLTGEG